MQRKIRLNRASSLAYKQLQRQEEQEKPQEESAAAPDASSGELASAIAQIKLLDGAGTCETWAGKGSAAEAGGGQPASLSALAADVAAGQLGAAQGVLAFRLLCEAAITAAVRAGDRAAVQAASDLLDEGNALLERFDPLPQLDQLGAGARASPAAPASPAPAARGLPPETFFLPPAALADLLPLALEPSLFSRAAEAARAGKKRKGGGRPAAGFRRRPGKALPNPWDNAFQQALAVALRLALAQEGAPAPGAEEVDALPRDLATLARDLRGSQAGEAMRSMGASLANIANTLQVAGYLDFEEMVNEVRDESHAVAEAYMRTQGTEMRRGKVIGMADAFVNLLGTTVEAILSQMRAEAKARAAAAGEGEEDEDELMYDADDFYPDTLPLSIQANREPFKHVHDWRKTPFIPRPYQRLTEYYIVEPSMREVILRKLSTRKHGGCDGAHCCSREQLGSYSAEREGFASACACLAHNAECDARCGCEAGACLNRAVTNRQTLVVGVDVEEIDSWGMDCYTRRNIQDAIMESQAFGPHTPPDYAALLAAAPPGAPAAAGAGAHGAIAALSPPPPALQAPPGTPTGAAATAAAASPMPGPPAAPLPMGSPPTPRQQAVEHKAVDWMDRVLLPAINRQGGQGWDLLRAVEDVRARATAAGDEASLTAAAALEARVKEVGYNYFRIHPKGTGTVCKREGGIPPLTFVEEYLGEIHTPWRWFEIQDAVKKITGDELPDFYNIVLERPHDDPAGYDVLFIDAAHKGAFASRMSHSCTPNCQAIVMACGGRLTIALYTIRHVHPGEELTFDYSSVTESEKEFREAICLCSTRHCRGSYLAFTGSRAFLQVLNARHNFLHRQAIIARAGSEPLTQEDRDRLRRHGLGESALGSEAHGDRVPEWLEKWTALICEYLEAEEACLRADLLAKDALGIYTEASAAAEAKGVVANRLQNVVITLDKVKMVLQKVPGQPRTPPLRLLPDAEAAEHLWGGPRSVARRALRCAVAALAAPAPGRAFASAQTNEELEQAYEAHGGALPAALAQLCALVLAPAVSFEDARGKLLQAVAVLRGLDVAQGGGLTALADLLLLYASTQHWLAPERGYKGLTSPPVPLNLEDLHLDRTQTSLLQQQQQQQQPSGGGAARRRPAASGTASSTGEEEGAEAEGPTTKGEYASALRKKYQASYIWGQLNGWFKQTVNDPTASLSAERRGTLSLPDVESAFTGGKLRYTAKDRADLVEQLERRADSMWRAGSLWSFRNEARVYGSSALDAAWHELTGDGEDPLPAVIQELRTAEVPPRLQAAAAAPPVPAPAAPAAATPPAAPAAPGVDAAGGRRGGAAAAGAAAETAAGSDTETE